MDAPTQKRLFAPPCWGERINTTFLWKYGGQNVTLRLNTGWNGAHPMFQENGIWKSTLPLMPGSHMFKFLVDGTWNHDPELLYTKNSDGFGHPGFVNMLHVEAPDPWKGTLLEQVPLDLYPACHSYLKAFGMIFLPHRCSDLGFSGLPVLKNRYKYHSSWGKEGDGDGKFRHPMGIALDNFGTIYICDRWYCHHSSHILHSTPVLLKILVFLCLILTFRAGINQSKPSDLMDHLSPPLDISNVVVTLVKLH